MGRIAQAALLLAPGAFGAGPARDGAMIYGMGIVTIVLWSLIVLLLVLGVADLIRRKR